MVELLVTCAVTGLLTCVAISIYGNLTKGAQAVLKEKDQMELKEILESFRASGGSISAIVEILDVTNSALAWHRQAAAMTQLFQGNIPASVNQQYLSNKTRKGTVTTGLSPDKIIVPYLTDEHPNDTSARVVINADGSVQLITGEPAKSANGFIVVSETSDLGAKEIQFLEQNPSVKLNVTRTDLPKIVRKQFQELSASGAKYADSNAYVWNEDVSAIPGPPTTPVAVIVPPQGPAPAKIPLLVDVLVTGGINGGTSFDYPGYIGPGTVTVFVYRADGLELDVHSIPEIKAQLGDGQTLNPDVKALVQDEMIESNPQPIAVSGIGWTAPVALQTLLPAEQWASDSNFLRITASVIDSHYSLVNPNVTISVGRKIDLEGALVVNDSNGNGILDQGETITIDATANPSDVATISNVDFAGLNTTPLSNDQDLLQSFQYN